MKILTFDTTLNKTYICLNDNEKILKKNILETTDDKYHSAFLIQEIANLLKENHFTMEDIDLIGINIGPGSFTGIRACVTIGRVIAQQMDLPLVPCSSMEILSKISNKEKTAVVLDARKKSAYLAIYENGCEVVAPKVVLLSDLQETLKNTDYFVISDTAMNEFLKTIGIESLNYELKTYPLDEYLMKLTLEKIKNEENLKEKYNWAKVKPLYIQQPSIFGK